MTIHEFRLKTGRSAMGFRLPATLHSRRKIFFVSCGVEAKTSDRGNSMDLKVHPQCGFENASLTQFTRRYSRLNICIRVERENYVATSKNAGLSLGVMLVSHQRLQSPH
jgi:hypothetical protein